MVKRIAKKILNILPVQNIILFESSPDLADSTKCVFDEFIKREYNKKYKLVWVVSKKNNKYPSIHNVKYFNEMDNFGKIKKILYDYLAKCKISCNSCLVTMREGQVSFYISHGTAIKSVRGYYIIPNNVDYILVNGEKTKELVAYELSVDVNKTYALGYPRNDALINGKRNISQFFPQNENERIVVWYPTYRQHKNQTACVQADAIPLLHNKSDVILLNKIAKDNGVLIVLKPHPAQDISKLKIYNLSNIKFIDDTFYYNNDILAYEFISSCDALITDYSSIYYDFLLCNKPIGLIWEDYNEYKETVNFAVDMEYFMKAGEKIYNIADFEKFIKKLVQGNDQYVDAREEICAWANYSRDANSSIRVTDFIINKAAL